MLDSIAWAHDRLLPRLDGRAAASARWPCTRPAPPATCASPAKLEAVARELADEVLVPAGTTCCGMAGDRGLLHPELPASALRDAAADLEGRGLDACLCANRTCEIGLQQVTGARTRRSCSCSRS